MKIGFRNLIFGLFVSILPLLPQSASGQLKLPKLINDGMVLQHDTEITIWGWAQPNKEVTVEFKEGVYTTTTNTNGKWDITLPKLKAGGPFSMTLRTDNNKIAIKNILVGDVWVSSGQSNMVLPMNRVSPLYETDISKAENNRIRYFNVPDGYNFNAPRKDLPSGEWLTADPETVLNFSAVAYFFAKKLYDQYKIPIGIINTSLGGSPAEAWISEETLESEFPAYYNQAQLYKDSTLINKIQDSDAARRIAWLRQLNKQDMGYHNSDLPWYTLEMNTNGWKSMNLPGYWSNTELSDINGVVWFRKEIEIPNGMTGKPAKLNMGRIVDSDSYLSMVHSLVPQDTSIHPAGMIYLPES